MKETISCIQQGIMPDVEVVFEFIGTRRYPAVDGYRPHHLIKDDFITSGVHHYYNVSEVAPDGTATGTITFLAHYPHCLWVGKKINIQEGARVVGYATITKVINPILEKCNVPETSEEESVVVEYSQVMSVDKSGIKISTENRELFVDFKQCTQKFSQANNRESSTCVASRDVTMLMFSFYSSPEVSIYFNVKKRFGIFSTKGKQLQKFERFRKMIEELGYTTYDLS